MIPPIRLTPETVAVIRRIIWFEEPEQAARDPVRLLAYAFRHVLNKNACNNVGAAPPATTTQ